MSTRLIIVNIPPALMKQFGLFPVAGRMVAIIHGHFIILYYIIFNISIS